MPQSKPPPNADVARLSRLVMRRQAGLSLSVASVFLVMILGLPLVNRFLPAVASYPIFGFPASWLFLAVVFYPITVALSVYFVKKSDRIEAEIQQEHDLGEGVVR